MNCIRKHISMKMISIIIAVSFLFTSTSIDKAFAARYSGRNLAPQSVFSPLKDQEIHDIAMIEYVISSAVKSGRVDPSSESEDRSTGSLGIDLAHEDIDITFRFSEAREHTLAGLRLFPCTYRYDSLEASKLSEYWCCITEDESGNSKVTVFTEREKKSRDFKSKLQRSILASREEARLIQLALSSEIEQDEKIRKAISNDKYVVIDEDHLPKALYSIYGFLSSAAPRLLADFKELVDNRQLMIITETSEEGRLITPHAGSQGIYLPNDTQYVQPGWMIHEIFAKAGFTHDENVVFQLLFEKYLEKITDDNIDASRILSGIELTQTERSLLDEARAAGFVVLKDKSAKRDYSADKRRRRIIRGSPPRDQEAKYSNILGEVSTILSTTTDIEEELDDVADIIKIGLGLHGVNIGLIDEGHGRLRVVGASTEFNSMMKGLIKKASFDIRRNESASEFFNDLEDVRLISQEELLSFVFEEGTVIGALLRPLIMNIQGSSLGQMVIMPITDEQGHKLGAIHMTKMPDESFKEDEIRLLRTLSNNIALGIAKNRNLKRFKDIVESSPDSIITINRRGVITGCNPETEKMLGCSSEEILGEEFTDIGAVDDKEMPRILKMFSRLMKGRKVEPFEMEFIRKDFQHRIALIRPRLLSSGEVQIIATDVTAQRKMEREYKILIENAREGVSIVQDGVLKFVNPYWTETTGYTEKELIGMNVMDIVHPSDKQRIAEMHKRRLTGKEEPSAYVFKMQCKNGEVKWVRNNVVMHEWEGRTAVLCLSSDITELKRAEEEALRSKDFLERAVNAINEPVFVKDENHRWVLLNDAACKVMGHDREDLLFKSDYDIHPEEEARVFWQKDDEVLRAGGTVINEEIITWHGKKHTILTSKTVYTDKSSGEKYIVGTIHDLTERVETRKTLEKLLIESRMRHREIEALFDIANITHSKEFSLRTSLTEIAKCLKRGISDAKGLSAKIIVDGSEYASTDIEGGSLPVMSSDIRRGDKVCGKLKVFYNGEMADKHQGDSPLSEQQRHFIAAASQEISSMLERRKDAERLKSYQSELASVAQRWEETFNATHEMFAILDKDRNILRANAAFADLLGMKQEDLIGKNCCDLMHPALDMHPDNCPFGMACATGNSHTEVIFESDRGRWLEVSISPIENDSGEAVNFVHIIRDITERYYEGAAIKMQRDISLATSTSRNIPVMFDKILRLAMDLNGIDCGGAYVLNEATGDLELISHHGLSSDFIDKVGSYSPGSSKFELAMKGIPVFLSYKDLEGTEVFSLLDPEGLRSVAVLPIKSEGKVVGVMNLSSRFMDEMPEEVKDLLISVMSQAGEGVARRLLEESKKSAEEKMRLYVEQTPLAVIAWDLDFKVMTWNPAAEEMFGYTEEEAMGRHAGDLILPDAIREHLDGIWKTLLQNRGGTRSTNENITKDGRMIICDWYNTPLVDDSGKVIGVISQAMDVTEVKKAEDTLRKSEKMYKRLFNWMPVAVIMHNDEGEIVHVNVAATELFGYKRNEFTKLSLEDIDTPGFASTRGERHELQRKNLYWAGEGQHRTAAGRVFDSDVLTQRLNDGTTVSVIHDASARVVSVKSEVIASIVHDWNNARQGENLVLPEVCKRAMEEYPRGTVDLTWKELRALVASSIQSAQIGEVALDTVKGIDRLHPRKIDLDDIARHLRDQFSMKIVEADEKAPEDADYIRMSASGEAVFVDRKSIERILNNLVKNAVEFSHKGAYVSVGMKKKVLDSSDFDDRYSMPIVKKQGERNFEPGDEVIEITVSDQGKGMSLAVQEKIGEVRFTTRDGKGGSGLGLSGALDLVKRLSGDLELITREGAGSTFILRLRPASMSDSESILLPSPGKARNLRTLIIDDNAAARSLIESHLVEGVGISAKNIFAPENYKDMERRAEDEGSWDVVVLDQNLGGVRGFGADKALLGTELIKRYRDLGVFKEDTVVFIDSVTTNAEDINKIKEAGVPFVSKDSGRDAFLEVFSEAFYSRRPHLKDQAQRVDLVEVEEEDHLHEFMLHEEPGDYINEREGLNVSYYTLLSSRLHSSRNILTSIIGLLGFSIDKETGISDEVKADAKQKGDFLRSELMGFLNRIEVLIPFDRSGTPGKDNLKMSPERRLLLLLCEIEGLKKTVNETNEMILGFAEAHKDKFSDKYNNTLNKTVQALARFSLSSKKDGISLANALAYAYEASAKLESMPDVLDMKDEEIEKLGAFSGRVNAIEMLPAVLKKIRELRGYDAEETSLEEEDPGLKKEDTGEIHILVADDEEMIRDVFSMFLENIIKDKGHDRVSIDTVTSGEAAVEAIEKNGLNYYDVAIIDYNFKDNGRLGGMDVGEDLNKMGFGKEGGLLFLSSGEPHPEAETWFTGQLSKPADRDDIERVVAGPLFKVLDERESAEPQDPEKEKAEELLDQTEADLDDLFESSPVAIALFDQYAQVTDSNEAFFKIMDHLNLPRGISIFENVSIAPSESSALAEGEAVFKKVSMGGGEVYVNIVPFLGRDESIFGYMVQMQTKEDYDRVQQEAKLAARRRSEINKLTRKEKASVLQARSANKVALVYGGDFRKAIRMLGAIGFKGSIVLAKDKEELKEALTSGEQFDIIINTTSDDIKKILANLNVKVAIIDDLDDTNTFQNTLLEICA